MLRRFDDAHQIVAPVLQTHLAEHGTAVSSHQAGVIKNQLIKKFDCGEPEFRGALAKLAGSRTLDNELLPVLVGYMKNQEASGPPHEYFAFLNRYETNPNQFKKPENQ